MKKKIKKIIEKYIKNRKNIARDDYEKRSIEAENVIVSIKTIINQPKVAKQPKQLYCNFQATYHDDDYNEEDYVIWTLIGISSQAYNCIIDRLEDVNDNDYEFCSIPIENLITKEKK